MPSMRLAGGLFLSQGAKTCWRQLAIDLPSRGSEGVFLLDQEPIVPASSLQPNQRECPPKLPALELEAQLSALQILLGFVTRRSESSAVPGDDRPRTVLPLGDDSLEDGVGERVVGYPNGEMFLSGIHRRPFGHGP